VVEQAIPGRKNRLALVANPGGTVDRDWFNRSNHVNPSNCQLYPSLCLGLEFPDLGIEFLDLGIEFLDLGVEFLNLGTEVPVLIFPILDLLISRLVNGHLGNCEGLAKGS
jgi:hypothetical protein